MTKEEIGSECLRLIQKKLSKQISKEEYYAGLIELDRKCPTIGFREAAENYIRHQHKLEKDFQPVEVWRNRGWPLAEKGLGVTKPYKKQVQVERPRYPED